MGAASNGADSYHVESHDVLLRHPVGTPAPRRRLDAIVVPTIRPASLRPALTLAGELGCALVVLCSTPAQAASALAACGGAASGVHVTYVPASVEDDALNFLANEHPDTWAGPPRYSDIARKRNIGFLLARLSGWRTIMYLDDDIRDLSAAAVSAAAGLCANFQAAGFRIAHYPDNSVVCHAHRLSGGKQDIFPGGCALLVDVQRCDSLFPPVYNEDWLFLFGALAAHSVAVAGTLSQLEYDPFAHPRRAAAEEFGDLVAEGLFRLLHEGGSLADATQVYWKEMLENRFRLIDGIADRLLGTTPGDRRASAALLSLTAARQQLSTISELACAAFIHAWQTDLAAWRDTLLSLPELGEVAQAAKFLNLPTPDSWASQ